MSGNSRVNADGSTLRIKDVARVELGAMNDDNFSRLNGRPAVTIGVNGDLVVVLAAVGAGDEMLAAILGPAHGMAAAHRQPGQANLFRQQDALVAKASADIGR